MSRFAPALSLPACAWFAAAWLLLPMAALAQPSATPGLLRQNIAALNASSAQSANDRPTVATLADAQKLFRQGDYAGSLAAAEQGTTADVFSEDWWRLRGEALLALGRYAEAYTQLTLSLRYNPQSIRLRLLDREAALFTQHEDEARAQLVAIRTLIDTRGRTDRTPEFLTAVGEAALILGAEPKLVLENFLRPGQRASVRDAILAIGRLALAKHDYTLASRTFSDGLKLFTTDPEMPSGLAASFRESGDGEKFLDYAAQALNLNEHHIPTLLLMADHLLESEQYNLAREMIAKILAVNATQPDALALRAVIEQLENHPDLAAADRAEALSTWRSNPHVDHIIGQKLARNYRFSDAAAAQRRALASDAKFTPARIELAQDLLRLGQTDEGWALVAQAHKEDSYDVEAFNLVSLHDRLDTYTTVEDANFLIRMAGNEAPIYGQRALALLERARAKLAAKYGLELTKKTQVEIFATPGDFAVRTFGAPGEAGFLAVCFGSVITVNSPALSKANWEAVLWHEFTHVITLTMTENKMPRWLSEGISVFEETQENHGWGQLMSPNYHDLILEGKMKPVSNMSAAFLTASDPRAVGFAYFQSSLIVKFIVEKFGHEKLKAVLRTLANGTAINAALAQHLAPIAQLDTAFVEYARAEAKKLGGDLDLTPPDQSAEPTAKDFVSLPGSRNFYTRLDQVRELVKKADFEGAKARLIELTAGSGYISGANNPHMILADVAHQLGDTATERAALTTVAEHEADDVEPVTRLLALTTVVQDWPAITRWAEALIAINPLAAAPWRALLNTHEQAGAAVGAIEDARVLLRLDPPDLPSIHYRLARQLLSTGDLDGARRHVLQALEDAPRFRAAYELLGQLPPIPVGAVTQAAAPAQPATVK